MCAPAARPTPVVSHADRHDADVLPGSTPRSLTALSALLTRPTCRSFDRRRLAGHTPAVGEGSLRRAGGYWATLCGDTAFQRSGGSLLAVLDSGPVSPTTGVYQCAVAEACLVAVVVPDVLVQIPVQIRAGVLS
jgi:hypothetical protein